MTASTHHHVHDEILQKHLGILGINGSGKTYAAKGLAERLLDAKQRICVLDPTGVWYGLKSSATGKSGGYPVVIFGGPHADVQISGSHGDAIAEAIATSSTPAIIDVSQMRVGERTRFFVDFAETLRVKNVGPLNLFIDESHLFAPQGRVSDPASAQMLHAANNLISLGRSRGIRVTLISQRPAKLHKDSLSQVHSLIALRLIAPQDRAAVEAWIADQADIQKGKQIIASLPSLKTGEGWLWAPEHDILERIRFPKITTFDSSKTPDAGSTGPAIVLAPINLDAIQGKLASIKQEKVANDPSALRKRVAELESQLRAKHAAPPPDSKASAAATAEAYRNGFAACVEAYETRFEAARATLASKVSDLIGSMTLPKPKAAKAPALPSVQPGTIAVRPPAPTELRADDGSLSAPQRRIIGSLQFWKSIGHDTPSREQVAAVAGYSPSSGNFQNMLGGMRTARVIDYPAQGRVRALVEHGDAMTAEEARAKMQSVLSSTQLRLVEACAAGDDQMSREELGQRSGYSASSGNFQNMVGSLCTLGIFTRPAQGMIALSDWARELLT
jgi:uncharacterized protein